MSDPAWCDVCEMTVSPERKLEHDMVCTGLSPHESKINEKLKSWPRCNDHNHPVLYCYDCLQQAYEEAVRKAFDIEPETMGRIMHESWTKTKISQGFHHPDGCPEVVKRKDYEVGCNYCHIDLVPWKHLPEKQKDINRHAFDAVLEELRCRAGIDKAGENK